MWPVTDIISEMSWLDEKTKNKIKEETADKIIAELSKQAESLPDEETSVIALDWMNGRRTPDANQALKGAITGLSLGSDAPRIFKALVEATAFGSKMINERFISEGIRIDGVIAIGGVAKKNPFVMQIVADVLNMPIKVAASDQTCALGSAMAASVVAGFIMIFLLPRKLWVADLKKSIILILPELRNTMLCSESIKIWVH